MSERRWYLWFRDEFGNTEGLTGPYVDRRSAESALSMQLTGAEASLLGLDLDSVPPAAQCIYAPYNSVQVMEFSPEEIGALR